MGMPDGLRLYIHASTESVCAAKGLHRSGSRLRPISAGDLVLSSGDDSVPCGRIIAVDTERIDRENLVYRIQYQPLKGTMHPIDSWVVWRQLDIAPQRKQNVPAPIAQRMTQQVMPESTPPPAVNGKKRRGRPKKQRQQGNGTLASEPTPTA